jgi:hypothetical protein
MERFRVASIENRAVIVDDTKSMRNFERYRLGARTTRHECKEHLNSLLNVPVPRRASCLSFWAPGAFRALIYRRTTCTLHIISGGLFRRLRKALHPRAPISPLLLQQVREPNAIVAWIALYSSSPCHRGEVAKATAFGVALCCRYIVFMSVYVLCSIGTTGTEFHTISIWKGGPEAPSRFSDVPRCVTNV